MLTEAQKIEKAAEDVLELAIVRVQLQAGRVELEAKRSACSAWESWARFSRLGGQATTQAIGAMGDACRQVAVEVERLEHREKHLLDTLGARHRRSDCGFSGAGKAFLMDIASAMERTWGAIEAEAAKQVAAGERGS